MGRLFPIIVAFFYYILYPLILIIVIFGPLMDFDYLTEIYSLGAPRQFLGFGALTFIGFYLFLSYRFHRLGWLYRKFPVLLPFFQMCFIMLVGFEFALFFGNLWADKDILGKGLAISLSIIIVILARVFLSYLFTKYPISYIVHKL